MTTNNYQGSLQTPTGSGFSGISTASEIIKGIDLTGKIAIVTGGNSGIGMETTRILAGAGATVIVAARDIEKALANLKGIPNTEIQAMDLTDPGSIDTFAEKFLETGRPLHLLVNNAGIMWVPLRRDSRGIESQLATNYLGQFQLTARLWPALKAADGARVVNISSQGHQFSGIDFNDLNFQHRSYDTLLAYGQSKTAVNLFTMELDIRAREFNVRAYSVHPGSIAGTDLGREAPLELFQKMGFCDAQGTMLPEVLASLKTIPQGAATTVWCATSPALNHLGGVYCEDGDVAGIAPNEGISNGVKAYSLDPSDAQRLWTLSEEMANLSFIFR